MKMKTTEFCYWLQGFFEISDVTDKEKALSPEQVKVIKNHLAMVFYHDIDPRAGSAEHQGALQELHDGSGNTTTPRVLGSSGLRYKC